MNQLKSHQTKSSIRSKSALNSTTPTPDTTTTTPANPPTHKQVFRTVLDNPLNISWPILPPAVNDLILESLLALLLSSTPLVPSPSTIISTEPTSTSALTTTTTTTATSTIKEWRNVEHARTHRASYRKALTSEKGDTKKKSKVIIDTLKSEGVDEIVIPRDDAKKRKSETIVGSSKKKRKSNPSSALESESSAAPVSGPSLTPPSTTTIRYRPELLDYISVGINEVTKSLEKRIRSGRFQLGDQSAFLPPPLQRKSARSKNRGGKGVKKVVAIPPVIPTIVNIKSEEHEDDTIFDLIFVCRPDINPPSLVQHFPTMVAVMNGVLAARESSSLDSIDEGKQRQVLLIPLGIGAGKRLADVLGLGRVATIGISSMAPNISPLLTLLRKYCKPLTATWLIPHLLSSSTLASASPCAPTTSQLITTHIKHLRTTQPLDPKAAHAMKKDVRDKRKMEKKGKKMKEKISMRGAKEVYLAED